MTGVQYRGDSLDKYLASNHRFWTLLRQHGALAYFCGRTHNASAARINGVWQIDCGHAPGRGDPGAPSTFLKLYVDPEGVRREVYRSDGTGGPYRLASERRL